MKNILCIYHSHCMDGLGAAWAVSMKFKLLEQVDNTIQVSYLPCSYGNPMPIKEMLAADEVYIVDFSFDPESLYNFARNCPDIVITVIDHHKTAIEMFEAYKDTRPANLVLHLNKEYSGAGLTWYVLNDAFLPKALQLIQDRDLWKFTQKETKAFHEVSSIYIEDREAMFESLSRCYYHPLYFPDIITIGSVMLEKLNNQVDSIIESCKQPITINGIKGLVCNCSPMFASEVGNRLAQASGTFGATYFTDKEGTCHFSLRSNDASPVDVSGIAVEFGGGGHRNAAGFELCIPILDTDATGVVLWSTTTSTSTGEEYPDDN